LRVGDADRQEVVSELQRHYVEGRLTSEELGERVTHALAARTFGDLRELLLDLPVPSDALATRDSAAPYPEQHHHRWQGYEFSSPFGLVMLLVGAIVILTIILVSTSRIGFFFPWPLLIWGFFFIGGRPRHRRW
jgi:hypothetical protein